MTWRLLFIGLFALQPAFAATPFFPDAETSWYTEAIHSLRDEGVIHGYPDGTFRPKQLINRAEFLKILLGDRSAEAREGCFPDVPVDEWYAPFACQAKQLDIAKGNPDGTFRPEQPVNFVEALAFVYRAEGISPPSVAGEWHAGYEHHADREGILAKHTYIPAREVTRERAAQIIDAVRRISRSETRVRGWQTSPGCGQSAPLSAPTDFLVNGERRDVIVRIPAGYTPRTPHKLIVAFHGRTNSNAQVQRYFGIEKGDADFIVVYPAAVANGNGTFSWSSPGDVASQLRDLAFFDTIVAEMSERYCIDRDGVFVVGHSLGAWFANVISCVRGGVVRGAVTVAGSTSYSACRSPVASLFFHHPEDPAVSYASGKVALEQRIEQNNCSDRVENVALGGFQCQQWNDCRTGNPVLWCPYASTLGGAPHSWPIRGGETILTYFRSL